MRTGMRTGRFSRVGTAGAVGAVFLAGVLALAGASPADALSFTADAVQEGPGNRSETVRLFEGDEATRLEFSRQGRAVVQIFLPRQSTMRVLFPQDKTYFEVKGTPVAKMTGGGETPCASLPPGIACRRVAVDTSRGTPVEKWEATLPVTPPPSAFPVPAPSAPAESGRRDAPGGGGLAGGSGLIVLWWDPSRKMAIRVEYPDGAVIQKTYKGQTDWQGRKVEKWETDFPAAQGGQKTVSLYDPELGISVREELPGGVRQELRNIRLTPTDPAWFAVPADYRQISPPPAPTEPPPTPR